MSYWKMQPKAKVYEALSAIADGRVTILNATSADVASSSRNKTYTVKWDQDAQAMTSNDNGTHWQGYIGYPMIAVLMMLGKLDHSAETTKLFAGVHWKQLNDEFHNNYEKAADVVLDDLEAKGAERVKIEQEVTAIYEQLQHLNLQKLE